MAQVDSEDTPARPALPPRPPTSQQRADELLMRWRLARAAGIPADRRLGELTPRDVLSDLFEERLVADPEGLAAIVVQRLIDAGFEVTA